MLRKRAQRSLVRRLYNLISDILNTLDSWTAATTGALAITNEPVIQTGKAAQTAIEKISIFSRSAAKASAVGWYLIGLPAGALIVRVGMLLLLQFPFRHRWKRRQLAACYLFGTDDPRPGGDFETLARVRRYLGARSGPGEAQ